MVFEIIGGKNLPLFTTVQLFSFLPDKAFPCGLLQIQLFFIIYISKEEKGK